MSCRGPLAENTLLFQVIQASYPLRKVPPPGASVADIWAEFQILYPGQSSEAAVNRALIQGARRGAFTKCASPVFSQTYYYRFNPGMVARNWSNRNFSIPLITDVNSSGSGYTVGGRNGPLEHQNAVVGLAGPNYQPCSVDPPSPLRRPSRFDRRIAPVLTCGQCPQ